MGNSQNSDFKRSCSSQNSFRVMDAVIQTVTADRSTTFVTIEYENRSACQNQTQTQVTLIVNKQTEIRNERGKEIPAENLESGMIINAIVSKNMTRSIPPQAQAFQICVQNTPQAFETTSGCILEVNRREQYIQTISNGKPSSMIRFNISPETRIFDKSGRKISFSDLTPGLHVCVEHANFMTASIPPQTSAFTIRVV